MCLLMCIPLTSGVVSFREKVLGPEAMSRCNMQRNLRYLFLRKQASRLRSLRECSVRLSNVHRAKHLLDFPLESTSETRPLRATAPVSVTTEGDDRWWGELGERSLRNSNP